MSDFHDVGIFHEKFGLPNCTYSAPDPREMSDELYDFRLKFLEEELQEFRDAHDAGDIAGMADALIDLVYVAMGTGHVMGLPWDELWEDVQRANMSKQRAAADGSDSKRLSSYDVVKPAGWVGPRTSEILGRHR